MDDTSDAARELRKLPQVDRLTNALSVDEPRRIRVSAARKVISDAATAIKAGGAAPTFEGLVVSAETELRAWARAGLVGVINATGVLLHTNLGRAPLGIDQIDAMRRAASYSNLEFDLAEGKRGSRYDHSRRSLAELTGAEDALVVNNNAAAVLLSLASLARGREVIISRGQLIEIGGEFRIPEIMAESGAVMREVGTTNRTHLKDYRKAIGSQTAAIMKVHPSNYKVVGFSAEVGGTELAELASANDLVFINDLGSGLIDRQVAGTTPPWLSQEPTVIAAIQEGADIVTFSGDKLFGGPQCGLIVGKAGLIQQMKSSPLLRTLRVDKTTLLALEATLNAYLSGREGDLPLWSMALMTAVDLEARAGRLLAGLETRDAVVKLVDGHSTMGGGSAPGSEIPTILIEITSAALSTNEIHRRLLDSDPPVIARIVDDRVVIDLRTVADHQDSILAAAVSRIV